MFGEVKVGVIAVPFCIRCLMSTFVCNDRDEEYIVILTQYLSYKLLT